MKISEILHLPCRSYDFLITICLLIMCPGCNGISTKNSNKNISSQEKSSEQKVKSSSQTIEKLKIDSSVLGQVHWTIFAEKVHKETDESKYYLDNVRLQGKNIKYQIKSEKGFLLNSDVELYKNEVYFDSYLLKTHMLKSQSKTKSWTSPEFKLIHKYTFQSGKKFIWIPHQKKIIFQEGKALFIY